MPSPSLSSPAPGWPGIPPRWTSSAKDGVGTALGSRSRIWYAVSHGIVNEVYFHRIDQASTRDFQLIVTDGDSFFSEEKRDTDTTIEMAALGVPLFRVTNRCRSGRYILTKDIFADPERDTFVQQIHLEKWSPELRLFALLAPHISNAGMGNNASVGDYKGLPLLVAQRGDIAMALACSTGWSARSVGFVGTSDGWQDLNRSKSLTWSYTEAENGNVALAGEIAISGDSLRLALGFGHNPSEAGHHARSTLAEPYRELREKFVAPWTRWQRQLTPLSDTPVFRASTAALRSHEDKTFRGGTIASLSIPWGASKGDDDLGGYHLVWPRDLAQTAGGFLAAGAGKEALRILEFLRATQEPDGHWPQNMWLDGTPYWHGIQLDEVALPVLLADQAFRGGTLTNEQWFGFWPMVRSAVTYIIDHGPVSSQDRWEEEAGCSTFTLAAEIAALVAAAGFAKTMGDATLADTALATADHWHSKIDDWTYAENTQLAKAHDVAGYYVRISPPGVSGSGSPLSGFAATQNRPPSDPVGCALETVSPDALALVRFGLRAPDDPRILDTVKVIDALLKRDLPGGPAWCRYNGDRYGEHDDGTPFDGTGRGRPWPLLTGERAHYELALGNLRTAADLATSIASFANGTGLIPEQAWDAADIPARELFRGRPTGSAMPLVWAHSEYIKLLRSLRDRAIFDLPPQTVARYLHAP